MFARNGQLFLVLTGASLGAVGWGAVLPFLYADISRARGFGPTTAALTFTFLAVGALLAAPLAGRVADGPRPVAVATGARLAMVAMIAGLMLAGAPGPLWLAAFGYGAALAVVQPAVSVLVLALAGARRRRDVFAWQFIGQNLGLALGGVVGGYLVDLTSATGTRPAYLFAMLGSGLSALLVGLARVPTGDQGGRRDQGDRRDQGGRRDQGAPRLPDEPATPGGGGPVGAVGAVGAVGYRAVLRAPGVRWLLGVTLVLTLACYAQFDSGLPSYALTVLDVAPSTLGTAVAVNAVLVAALTAPVVRVTRGARPSTLLALCALIWIGVWLVLAVPMIGHADAAGFVIGGFGLFSVGETMLAPVLTPLAATLAPAGAVGRTLAAMNGAQTAATAVGPMMSGVLLGLGLPAVFIGLQVACCVLAVVGAGRLGRATARPRELALAA